MYVFSLPSFPQSFIRTLLHLSPYFSFPLFHFHSFKSPVPFNLYLFHFIFLGTFHLPPLRSFPFSLYIPFSPLSLSSFSFSSLSSFFTSSPSLPSLLRSFSLPMSLPSPRHSVFLLARSLSRPEGFPCPETGSRADSAERPF